MRKVLTFPFRVILSEEDIRLVDEKGNIYMLSRELGWWDNKAIYIYKPGLSGIEKLGILLHEIIEMLLEKLFVPHKIAHFVANVFEMIFTLGKSKLSWEVKDGNHKER